MTVALPGGKIASATPRFIDRGGILRPSLGGPDQRLDRLGSKWGVQFQTVPMKGEDARIWSTRLIQGTREKASIKFPQPGVSISATRDYNINGNHVANAEVLTISSGFSDQIGKTFSEGQFFSINTGDERYVHQITVGGTVALVSGANRVDLQIQPPLRRLFNSGVLVEVLAPKIEGYVSGEEATWTVDHAKIYGFSFSIDEAR